MNKPLNRQAYGKIPHLPGSRLGSGDHHINEGMAKICLESPRRQDRVIVQEKLDGACVSIAKINGEIIPLGRAGYPAISSTWEHLQLFHHWVMARTDRFDQMLQDGERLCGEWLALAHSTRYNLTHEPFVAFDIIREKIYVNSKRKTVLLDQRVCFDEFCARTRSCVTPRLLFNGEGSFSIAAALEALEDRSYHGAIDPIEGAVWRVETNGELNFITKYVRHDKVDGCYLPNLTGKPPIWNWQP